MTFPDEKSRRNIQVNILKAGPRLTYFQRSIVEHDYAMTNVQHVITTRSAFIPYAIQLLNIDLDKPEAQQIEVANVDEVRKHAF